MLTAPDLSRGTYRVWQRNRDVLLRLWKAELTGFVIEPWLVLFGLGIGLGQFVSLDSGDHYLTFLAPGVLVIFPMFAAVFECSWGSYVRMEMQHTYDAIVATPVSVDDVVAGDMSWGMTRSMLNASYVLLALAILDRWLPTVASPWALLIVPLSLVPGLLFSAVSMCFVSVARSMSQLGYFFNLVVNPMFWFGGAFFPIDRLPAWAQWIAWFIPPSHVVAIYRGLLAGDLEWSMLGHLAWLVVATALFFMLALAGMRRRLIR